MNSKKSLIAYPKLHQRLKFLELPFAKNNILDETINEPEYSSWAPRFSKYTLTHTDTISFGQPLDQTISRQNRHKQINKIF